MYKVSSDGAKQPLNSAEMHAMLPNGAKMPAMHGDTRFRIIGEGPCGT